MSNGKESSLYLHFTYKTTMKLIYVINEDPNIFKVQNYIAKYRVTVVKYWSMFTKRTRRRRYEKEDMKCRNAG